MSDDIRWLVLEVGVARCHGGADWIFSLMNDDTPTSDSAALRDDPPPRPPVEPDPGDCCGNGCDPCIFDFYEEARQQYRELLAAWRARHPDVDPSSFSSTPDASGQRVP